MAADGRNSERKCYKERAQTSGKHRLIISRRVGQSRHGSGSGEFGKRDAALAPTPCWTSKAGLLAAPQVASGANICEGEIETICVLVARGAQLILAVFD